ncbi:MAG: helix-turn-helix transcriptional regulator [Pseudonocardiaceae bacterium]
MEDHSRTVIAVLLSPQGRAAVAAGETGTLVRLMREARGWTQSDLADRSGYSQPTISRLERGTSRAARDTVVLADVAQALGAPVAALGVSGPLDDPPMLDNVERRDLLGGAASLAVTVLLPRGVATPGRIDTGQAVQCWTALRRLFELDDCQGGATVYPVAEGIAQRLQDALRRGSYSSAVGRELQSVTAATMEHAGWLAYDAGWQQKARQWWLETCHFAELTDVPGARVTALASMALQASNTPGGGRETVSLARAARTVAKKDQSLAPTLLSVLAAREAVGHAQTGDRGAAVTAIGEARQWLDHGRRGDEPFWLDFWGPADLAWHETRVALVGRNGKSAEVAARAALASSAADAFPRNHVVYTVGLASVLTQLGQLDEAISVASDAIHGVQEIRGSGLIIADLRRTVDLLGQQKYPPATTFATAARRLLPASR